MFAAPPKNEFWPTDGLLPGVEAYTPWNAEFTDLGFAPPIKYAIPEDETSTFDVTQRCKIDSIDVTSLPNMSAEELMKKYQHKPVLLRGLLNSSRSMLLEYASVS